MGRPETDADFLAALAVQNAAYGDPPPTPADADRLRAVAERGGVVATAVLTSTGQTVAAGLCDTVRDGLGELAGVAVAEGFRRRCLATALTAGLTRAAFDAGVSTAFLTPIGDAGRRIYERVGYVELAGQMHISLPDQPGGLT